MKAKEISFIIPIYNRPEEAKELLQSFTELDGDKSFEIVIVEDGSSISSKDVVESFSEQLNISYYYKKNTGPGPSRNYGMSMAKGEYFIILDSDCLLPKHYMTEVVAYLNTNYVDCFGGPDAAHQSFTTIQKAINFSMTSFITTGGIRGKASSINKFQPRSFNMGLSKKAFEATQGFGNIHPGEDPDLSIRLWKLGFKTALFPKAYVYHKRRISWSKFYKQVYKFGSVRPILNIWHPHTKKITYWFPLMFLLGLATASVLGLLFHMYWPLLIFGAYFTIGFLISLIENKNVLVALTSVFAIFVQFLGYGYGFIRSTLKLSLSNKSAEEVLPEFFFKID